MRKLGRDKEGSWENRTLVDGYLSISWKEVRKDFGGVEDGGRWKHRNKEMEE